MEAQWAFLVPDRQVSGSGGQKSCDIRTSTSDNSVIQFHLDFYFEQLHEIGRDILAFWRIRTSPNTWETNLLIIDVYWFYLQITTSAKEGSQQDYTEF